MQVINRRRWAAFTLGALAFIATSAVAAPPPPPPLEAYGNLPDIEQSPARLL
jgi:hypothetical protein